MLLIFTTFLFLLAGVSLAFLLKRIFTPALPEAEERRLLNGEDLRPLFEPTSADLRRFEAEQNAELEAKHAEDERQLDEEKLVKLENIRQNWRESPNKAAAIELLYQASQTANGEAYLETANVVLDVWRNGKLPDLTPDDLAHLLDSHFWLLPAHERTPGASFRIQQEIAGLRRS